MMREVATLTNCYYIVIVHIMELRFYNFLDSDLILVISY